MHVGVGYLIREAEVELTLGSWVFGVKINKNSQEFVNYGRGACFMTGTRLCVLTLMKGGELVHFSHPSPSS